MASFDEEDLPTDLFQEPHGYFLREAPPHYVEHTLLSGETLHLRLVGSNPLWVVISHPFEEVLLESLQQLTTLFH